MRMSGALALATLFAAGCATQALTPSGAAPAMMQTFGASGVMYWVEGANSAVSRAMVRTLLPDDAPVVLGLVALIQPATSKPMRVAVAGTDSAYTAQVVRKALGQVNGDLSQLQLLFIGDAAHQAEVRTAADAKRATLHVAMPPG